MLTKSQHLSKEHDMSNGIPEKEHRPGHGGSNIPEGLHPPLLAFADSSQTNGVTGVNPHPDPHPTGEIAGNGVLGISHDATASGVSGVNENGGVGVAGDSHKPGGIGLLGRGSVAGRFEGDVEVTGDIRLVNGADCAEDFDVVIDEPVEPGTVMVIDDRGLLRQCCQAYDQRVTGVVSGAGNYRPAIVLDRRDCWMQRAPIALLGKVYCKADAQYGVIETGDFLTTSATAGHAMKANDRARASGSIIGKALQPLKAGRGLVPMLVALQ
jgi:hypothetical protein